MPELSVQETRQFITRPRPVILEIGANDGQDSQRFLEAYPDCWLYCFECDGRAIDEWHQRMDGRNGATLVEIAVSDDDGQAEFYPSGGKPPGREETDWNKSGSLLKPTGHLQYSPWCTFGVPQTVTTMRLDTWMDFWPHAPFNEIDFLWMDVQGAEAKVLRGARETIPKMRYIYLECHDKTRCAPLYDGAPTEADLRALLPGHECLGRYNDNLLFRRKDI